MLQGNLLTAGPPGIRPVPTERIELDARSWVEVSRGLLAGADDLLEELAGSIEWRVGRRRMYGRDLDDPRLMRWYRRGDPDPHPVLAEVRSHLEGRFGTSLGGVGLNHYRDGSDSVSFHADRELPDLHDSLVCILTLGQERPFLLRPVGGGRSTDLSPASGDLIVMGGACQARFEHAVPKSARRLGPRISASWRWSASGDRAAPRPGGYFESRRWRTLAR